MRATPPVARMSAGTRSSAMTAQAPASSAIFACSGVTTSMMTPPLSIWARLSFFMAQVDVSTVMSGCVPRSGRRRFREQPTGGSCPPRVAPSPARVTPIIAEWVGSAPEGVPRPESSDGPEPHPPRRRPLLARRLARLFAASAFVRGVRVCSRRPRLFAVDLRSSAIAVGALVSTPGRPLSPPQQPGRRHPRPGAADGPP